MAKNLLFKTSKSALSLLKQPIHPRAVNLSALPKVIDENGEKNFTKKVEVQQVWGDKWTQIMM